jgi:hypothetical protein
MVKIKYLKTEEAEIKTVYAQYRESGELRAGWRRRLLNGLLRAWSKAIPLLRRFGV